MSKIMKTNRRYLMHGKTVYCSGDIVADAELRPMLKRLGPKLVPLKDMGYEVENRLRTLSRLKPDHFPNSSRILLEVY